jgi:hypothetical protein
MDQSVAEEYRIQEARMEHLEKNYPDQENLQTQARKALVGT